MIRVTQYYEIAAEQIESIARVEGINKQHPYTLKIVTKTGQVFAVNYASNDDREHEIRLILAAIARKKQSNKLTCDDIRREVAAEVNKLRPYLRRIEKILKETKNEG